MSNKILIDASYPEQTRLSIVQGRHLENYDQEITNNKTLKGNIYLAKVTRVEPSLQACFVDYGRERHGFLSLTEIHPDYYRIPTADKKALMEDFYQEQEREQERQLRGDERRGRRGRGRDEQEQEVDGGYDSDGDDQEEKAGNGRQRGGNRTRGYDRGADSDDYHADHDGGQNHHHGEEQEQDQYQDRNRGRTQDGDHEQEQYRGQADGDYRAPRYDDEQGDEQLTRDAGADTDARGDEDNNNNHDDRPPARGRGRGKGRDDSRDDRDHDRRRARGQMRDQEEESDDEAGDDQDMDRSKMSRFVKRRRYKIQEVIKKGQVILVQVVKDERGQKGAAMTSYLSLAGRYCVVMPNATKGGGISRKIGPAERDHLRSVMRSLNMPKGMGLIIRTAGADRSENEIKDDYNYVLHLWDHIRELTVASTAPVMIYEEGSLIKKAILNYNNSSIDEIWIEGHEAYSLAVDTMKSIAPQEVSKIKEYEPSEHKYKSIFHFHDIEYEIQAIYEPYVPLPSGGMLVINQTEALVAIDVNSGKAIKERNIEETALRTNMEAAAEVARQLRLRDLSGQIVIDFIDMEDNRNIYQVERFFREQLRKDRARVQVARIGMFGMLEMTRQRLRPSITETVMQECPHCHGTGRSFRPEYYSLQFLRELFGLVQEKGAGRVVAEVPPELAQDLLAHKKDKLEEIEHTYKVDLVFADLSPKSLEPYIINYSKGRGKTAAPKTSKAKKQVAPLDFTTTAGTEQEA